MFKFIAFFITQFYAGLFSMVGILLICGKQLHDHTISPRGEVWAKELGLSPPLFFNEVPVPSQESEGRIFVC